MGQPPTRVVAVLPLPESDVRPPTGHRAIVRRKLQARNMLCHTEVQLSSELCWTPKRRLPPFIALENSLAIHKLGHLSCRRVTPGQIIAGFHGSRHGCRSTSSRRSVNSCRSQPGHVLPAASHASCCCTHEQAQGCRRPNCRVRLRCCAAAGATKNMLNLPR